MTEDIVNAPKHYKGLKLEVQCRDITRHMGFDDGNAFKYVFRAGLKDGNDELQDLNKALNYLNDMLVNDIDPTNSYTAQQIFGILNHQAHEVSLAEWKFPILEDIVHGNIALAKEKLKVHMEIS